MNNRRLKVREFVGIFNEILRFFLHEELGKGFVPYKCRSCYMLTKIKRISEKFLCGFQQNPTDFCPQFIAIDETWVNARPKRQSAGKIMT